MIKRFIHSRQKRNPSPYLLDTIKVKQLKAAHGVSDMDIAVALRVSPSTISFTINNRTRGLVTQQGIAKYFDVPFEEISHPAPPTGTSRRARSTPKEAA